MKNKKHSITESHVEVSQTENLPKRYPATVRLDSKHEKTIDKGVVLRLRHHFLDENIPPFFLEAFKLLEKDQGDVSLGETLITACAARIIDPLSILQSLMRHRSADWGSVEDADEEANEHALKHGGRLISVYYDSRNQVFYIITDAARISTTILLPEIS